MPTFRDAPPTPVPRPHLALWGGMESTINRVGDTFFDQFARGGHRDRLSDLDLIRDLGINTLRYPLHWERFAEVRSWQPFDDAFGRLQQLGIQPITGLVHHGSGPRGTDLLDPGFAPGLAAHALAVAQRYPWIESYTPVNEPGTTARFSTLYGHWYPHHHSIRSFVRALTNQIRASVLSMQAIRTVRPDARFVHTEDAGKTWSTSALEPDCLFREHRRWLGVDLLTGAVGRHHPLFAFLLENGLSEAEILWFTDNPCPPDVLGLNYYLTSDRYLDHRLGLYPSFMAGGDNGEEPFVDIEAVRVRPGGIAGSCQILTEAWDRYHLPVAITEAHLGGGVEDQALWLNEIWRGAEQARAGGVDCLAVTVWALFGSWNWSNLVTRDTGAYEPGVFALGARHAAELSRPRPAAQVDEVSRLGPPDLVPTPTPLASLVRELAAGRDPQAPERAGWWSATERLLYPPEFAASKSPSAAEHFHAPIHSAA